MSMGIFTTEFSTTVWGDVGNPSANTTAQPVFASVLLGALQKYYTIVIIVFGLIGNSISAVVFSGNQLRSRSSSYYLAGLAVSDAVFLAALLLLYLGSEQEHDVACKLLHYLSYVTTFLSVWLIVGFTIERFIAVQYPLQRPRMCTVKRAKFIVLGLGICAFLMYTYIFTTTGLIAVDNGNKTACGILPMYRNVMAVLTIMDTVLTCILPVLLIIIMNTMIAVQLYRFSTTYAPPIHFFNERLRLKNRDESEQNPSASSLLQPCGDAGYEQNSNPEDERRVVVIHYIKQGIRTSQNEEGSGFRTHSRSSSSSRVLSQRLQFNITKMLLVISTIFIGLNLPSYVMRIYTMLQNDYDENLNLVQLYFQLLFYTHFSVNFLLYSIYGVAFRRALLSFVCDKLKCRCNRQTQHVTIMYKCMHVIHRRT